MSAPRTRVDFGCITTKAREEGDSVKLIAAVKASHAGLIPWLPPSNQTKAHTHFHYFELALGAIMGWNSNGKPELQSSRNYIVRKNSRSGDRSRTLPRRFTKARSRCHWLIRRLAVKGVTFAALGNASFVIWSTVPPAAFLPIVRARVTST